MRILMISDFYHPVLGGVEKHVRSLSTALVERGHHVAVATLQCDDFPSFEVDQGVHVHRIRGSAQRLAGLFSHPDRPWAPPLPDPELLWSLRRIVAKEQPDIVHGHDWLARSYVPLKSRSRARFLITLHYYTLSCAKKSLMYNGHPCSGPGFLRCTRCAIDHYGLAKGLPTVYGNWAMSNIEHRAVDMFFAVSHATAGGNELVGNRWPYQVVPNFVPSGLAEISEDTTEYVSQLPEDGYLLFVGDLRRDKGLDVLLEAYVGLSQAPPLVLIGKVWPETPTEFPTNVTVLKHWPNYAVMEAWRRSSIAVVPSIWPEPCATVVIEAMVSGRPVVATCIGGNPDMVLDERTGILVPEGDSGALRAAIERLLADPDLRQRMGEAGRQHAKAFQADTVVPRIERVYADLIERKSPGFRDRHARADAVSGTG
jgi:glycosyltransferase involved in cell wall biosynthesis